MMTSHSFLLTVINVTDKSCRENQSTHFSSINPPPPPRKLCLLWDVEKYCRGEQATDGNMAHPRCMLDNYGYKHTHTRTHTQNMHCLFFHSNNGYANVPQCYVIRTLPVLYHNTNHNMNVCTFDTVRSIHSLSLSLSHTHTHTHSVLAI